MPRFDANLSHAGLEGTVSRRSPGSPLDLAESSPRQGNLRTDLLSYDLRFLRQRFDWKPWGSRASPAFLAMIAVAILGELVSVPLPVLDTRLPKVHADIGQDKTMTRSLFDVPLDMNIAKFQYYQTALRKKFITGFIPLPSRDLTEYANTFPLIKAFKEPDHLLDGE
jgi:hypothetical protein